jgi:hypothetical protein
MTKSMNGIIVYDDGAGTVIENGTVTTNTFETTNFNCNNIQGISPADNITLYTDTTGNIRLGELSTNLNTISGATVDLRSTDLVFDTNNDTDFETGNNLLMNTIGTTDIISSQITLNATGKVRIGGGQDIEPVTPANSLYIGKDITSANFFLGNATYPPSCTATATTANHICNYSTVQSLISGAGSILGTNNTWTGTNNFQNTTTISGLTNINQGGTLGTTINTAGNSGTIIIGNVSTPTNTISGAAVNINNSVNGNVNIASVLNTTSTITLGNNSANCTLNIGRQMTPTYTYTDANGANVATAIGYYNESVSFSTTTIGTNCTGMLNFSIPDDGVWMVIFSVRVESNTTSSSSVSRLAIGLGETSGDFNYCEFWSGTAVVSGTTAVTKTYLAPLCTHVDRFPAGKGVWVNALGNGNNGIRALIKSAKWTRLA